MGRVVTWSSSLTAVATVSPNGLVTGVAAGSATITAVSEGKSGAATITVSGSTQQHTGRFVTPTGSSSGDGTMGKPCDLATALPAAGGEILPGAADRLEQRRRNEGEAVASRDRAGRRRRQDPAGRHRLAARRHVQRLVHVEPQKNGHGADRPPAQPRPEEHPAETQP